MIEVLPDGSAASNPFNVPFGGLVTTDHVSVLLMLTSLTVNNDVMSVSPEFSHTVSVAGLAPVNVSGASTVNVNGAAALTQLPAFVTVTVPLYAATAAAPGTVIVIGVAVSELELTAANPAVVAASLHVML